MWVTQKPDMLRRNGLLLPDLKIFLFFRETFIGIPPFCQNLPWSLTRHKMDGSRIPNHWTPSGQVGF